MRSKIVSDPGHLGRIGTSGLGWGSVGLRWTYPFPGRPKPSQHGRKKCFVVCSWNIFCCHKILVVCLNLSKFFFRIKLNLSISCFPSFSNFSSQPPRLVTLHLMGRVMAHGPTMGPLLGFGKRKIQAESKNPYF